MSDPKYHCRECDFHWANGHAMSCSRFDGVWCGIVFTDDQVSTIKAGGTVHIPDSMAPLSGIPGHEDGTVFGPGFRAFSMKVHAV